jgi:hypothetical protein
MCLEGPKFQIPVHDPHAIFEIQIYQNKTPTYGVCLIMKASMISDFPCLLSEFTPSRANGSSYPLNVSKNKFLLKRINKYSILHNNSTNIMLKIDTQRPPKYFDQNMFIFREVKYKV